jgi:hypothetical protein
MANKPPPDQARTRPRPPSAARLEREAAALRANLLKRKAQARAKAETAQEPTKKD